MLMMVEGVLICDKFQKKILFALGGLTVLVSEERSSHKEFSSPNPHTLTFCQSHIFILKNKSSTQQLHLLLFFEESQNNDTKV